MASTTDIGSGPCIHRLKNPRRRTSRLLALSKPMRQEGPDLRKARASESVFRRRQGDRALQDRRSLARIISGRIKGFEIAGPTRFSFRHGPNTSSDNRRSPSARRLSRIRSPCHVPQRTRPDDTVQYRRTARVPVPHGRLERCAVKRLFRAAGKRNRPADSTLK